MLDIVFLVGSFFTQSLEIYVIPLNTIFSVVIEFFSSKTWLALVYIFCLLNCCFLLFSFFEFALYFFNVLFSLAWPSLWVSLDFCQVIHILYFFHVPFWRFIFFIWLGYFLLFLCVLCNCVLVPVLIRKQYPFPIFMD